MERPLPNWLRLWFQSVLIGEIYPEIRAIVAGYSKRNELLVRYYLDREPIEYDYDSISMVTDELSAHTSNASQFTKIDTECIYSNEHISLIDILDGVVYARREYVLE